MRGNAILAGDGEGPTASDERALYNPGMAREIDIRRIEVIGDMEAAILRRMGGTRRLAKLDEMCEFGRAMMAAGARYRHPDWTDEQVRREVARIITDAAA